MTITTTIATHYKWRLIAVGVVCAVLGVWGVYDYAIAIPRKQRAYERAQVCERVSEALGAVPGTDEFESHRREAMAAVNDEALRILNRELEAVRGGEPIKDMQDLQQKLEQVGANLRGTEEGAWLEAMTHFARALASPRAPGELAGIHQQAYDNAKAVLNTLGSVTRPSQFDRATQWAFILCLPMAPYFFWLCAATRRRMYQLDEDGTLHLPGKLGAWRAEEIADIDMSRWMAKSTAQIVHTDGRRVLLDDYKHKNLHLIIGAIASRLYPDAWTAEARVVKPADAEASALIEENAQGADSEDGFDPQPVAASGNGTGSSDSGDDGR
jgi:hypothetical protein